MDRGAWRATVHSVAKSQTQLSDSAHSSTETVLVNMILEGMTLGIQMVEDINAADILVHKTAFQDKELSSTEAENLCVTQFQVKDLSHKMHSVGKAPSSFSSSVLVHFKSLQPCPTVCDSMDHMWHARLLCPRALPCENTGVGCHALLQHSSVYPSVK